MRWGRGAFRLWLVATVLWVVLITGIAVWLPAEGAIDWSLGEWYLFCLGLAAIPPVIAFLVGWFLLWALKGFQQDKAS